MSSNPNQTLTCPLPSDVNGLPNVGFRFNVTKLPEISFWCQTIDLPEIQLDRANQETPLSSIHLPGDKLTYNRLSLTFLIDAKMANYKAVHNWLIALGFPEDNEQYSILSEEESEVYSELATNFSDGTLAILNSSNNTVSSIQFVNLFPTSIGSLTFDSTVTDTQYLIGNVDFDYSYYKFI